jgi:hypothetical protein
MLLWPLTDVWVVEKLVDLCQCGPGEILIIFVDLANSVNDLCKSVQVDSTGRIDLSFTHIQSTLQRHGFDLALDPLHLCVCHV